MNTAVTGARNDAPTGVLTDVTSDAQTAGPTGARNGVRSAALIDAKNAGLSVGLIDAMNAARTVGLTGVRTAGPTVEPIIATIGPIAAIMTVTGTDIARAIIISHVTIATDDMADIIRTIAAD